MRLPRATPAATVSNPLAQHSFLWSYASTLVASWCSCIACVTTGADVDKPRVSDEKPTITGIIWRPVPKIHCPSIFCGTKAATATAPAATAHP
uniref:Uncharacterized protein n=1 Tax=Aegilops tauschii subsp. strangulata TaxID=200361 RepID=A0A453QDM2_AEGTS